MNSWEKERTEQEAADKWLRDWAWKDYREEQDALTAYESKADLGGFIPVPGKLHTLDDYAAWRGMAPEAEQLFR